MGFAWFGSHDSGRVRGTHLDTGNTYIAHNMNRNTKLERDRRDMELAREAIEQIATTPAGKKHLDTALQKVDAVMSRSRAPLATGLEAANFGANTYDALSMDSGNQEQYALIAAALQNWLEADGDLPARYGDGTTVKRTIAAGVHTLGDEYQEGWTIYIISATLQGNRGVYVLQMPPDATTFTEANLITAIAPDIDVETLGSQLNVLGTHLEVAIQQSTGAEATVRAFSNTAEAGLCVTNPIQALPGKLKYVTEYKQSISKMLTDQVIGVADLTANAPDSLVRMGGDYDQQSENVRLPQGYVKPRASSAVETGNVFTVNAFASDDPLQNTQVGFRTTVSTEPNGEVLLWSLSTHEAFFRHILLDGFTLTFNCFEVIREATQGNADFRLTVKYIDGTSFEVDICKTGILESWEQLCITYTFDGAGAPHDKQGVAIIDILVHGVSTNAKYRYRAGTSLSVAFHHINGATRYSTVMITGAKKGQTLSINQDAQTEVKVDPTGDIGRYLETKPVVVPDNDITSSIYEAMRKNGAGLLYFKGASGQMNWNATDFSQKAQLFLHGLTGVGKGLIHEAGDVSGVTNVGNLVKDVTGEVRRGRRRMRAATFRAKRAATDTHFKFPIISEDGNVTRQVTVKKGHGVAPDFLLRIGIHDLHSTQKYTGESHGLAFALAALYERGAPVNPGLYSGEVSEMRMHDNSAVITLMPVARGSEKLEAYKNLVLYGPRGLVEGGKVVQLAESDMLSGFKNVNVVKIPCPDGYPDQCRRLTLYW